MGLRMTNSQAFQAFRGFSQVMVGLGASERVLLKDPLLLHS